MVGDYKVCIDEATAFLNVANHALTVSESFCPGKCIHLQ